jgi:NADPH:quinone reductase-like Zn-dependent oxidoreductase
MYKDRQDMKAVYITKYGGSDQLVYGPLQRPEPKSGQVLVRVRAAAVNPRDWILRDGRYVFKFVLPRFPIILGSDLSGEIVKRGSRASRFRTGDEVFGMQPLFGGMGAYAEYVAIDETALARKPPSISHVDAAAVPCAGLTAWQALVNIGGVGQGTRVTVCGASGGVGSYAVQFAKARGARVTAVCSAPNADLAHNLGADAVADYKTVHFTKVVGEQDIVFDAVGRDSFRVVAPVLASGGRYITTIPGVSSVLASLATGALRLATFGRKPSAHLVLVRANGDDLEQIAMLMAQGRVKSLIDSRYPLAEARGALERSRSWRSRGKIVLEVA